MSNYFVLISVCGFVCFLYFLYFFAFFLFFRGKIGKNRKTIGNPIGKSLGPGSNQKRPKKRLYFFGFAWPLGHLFQFVNYLQLNSKL